MRLTITRFTTLWTELLFYSRIVSSFINGKETIKKNLQKCLIEEIILIKKICTMNTTILNPP